jgi:hypothetical protein
MIYEWKESTRHPGDPQQIGESVSVLVEANGGVCPPDAVVEAARDETSPLHPIIFRLDRDQAADAWYRQEARQVVNDLVVVLKNTPVRPAAFLSVSVITSEGPKVGYARRDVVLSSAELTDQAVVEAIAALNGWRRRYRHLTELDHVFAALDSVTV